MGGIDVLITVFFFWELSMPGSLLISLLLILVVLFSFVKFCSMLKIPLRTNKKEVENCNRILIALSEMFRKSLIFIFIQNLPTLLLFLN